MVRTADTPANTLGEIALLALAYAAFALLGLVLAFSESRVPSIWPAAGVALAALLWRGMRLWPGILLGSVASSVWGLIESSGSVAAGLGAALLIGVGATLEAVLACELTTRLLRTRDPLGRLRTLFGFFGLAVLLAPLVSATFGALALGFSGYQPWSAAPDAWWGWWLGDATGILLVTPAVLVAVHRHAGSVVSRSGLELALLVLCLAGFGLLAFGPRTPVEQQYPLAFLALPLLVWAALRFGLPGAVLVNVTVTAISVGWTAGSYGPFAGFDVAHSLRLVQIFVCGVSITSLALAVTLEERAAAQAAVTRAHGELERRVRERTGDLVASVSLLRATLESTADGILVIDRQGRIVAFNTRFAELWKLPREVLATVDDRRALEHVLPQLEDPDAFLAGVQALYDAPERESLDVLELRDGSVYERSSKPQRVANRVVGRVWSFRDVTARVRAERERDRLLVEERQAREVAESSHLRAGFLAEASRRLGTSLDYEETVRICVQLAWGTMVDWAGLFLGASGQRAAASFSEGLVNRGDPDVHEEVAEALATGRSVLHERPPSDAAQAPLRWILCVPLHARGRALGVLALGRLQGARPFGHGDVEQAEELGSRCALALDNAALYSEAQQAIRVRDDFLSIASHELKTPLTSLKLQVQRTERLVAGGASHEEIAPHVRVLGRQTRRLQGLIDNLLDINRITSDRIALELESVDLAEVVREAVAHAEDDARRAGARIELSLEPGLVGRWDRVRLEQVVGNLVANAIKYGGGRPIRVRTVAVDGGARLLVEDRGIGISGEDQARIFERFERAVASRHYGGFGLGLWIVRQVVEALGGRIKVQSEAGQGSVFCVDLPFVPPAELEAPALGS